MDPHKDDHMSSASASKLSAELAVLNETKPTEEDRHFRANSDGDYEEAGPKNSKERNKIPFFRYAQPAMLPPSWELELNENEFVFVKPKTPVGNVGGMAVEKIPKEEAICRFCFNVFEADMLKADCKCKFAIAHELCVNQWAQKKGNNKCDACEQDIQNIPVTVSSDPFSSTPSQEPSTSKRCWSLCS